MAETAQAAQAAAAKALLDQVGNLAASTKTITDQVEAMKKELAELAKLDIAKTVKEFEKLRATVEIVSKTIAGNRTGFYIPGLEDEAKKFSLVRACVAIKMNDWKNAGFEKEVFDQSRLKAGAVVGTDSSGGYFVPDQVIADVIAAIYTRSVLISLIGEGTTRVSVLDGLTGIPVKIPRFMGGMLAYWIGEEDDYVESMSKVANVSMTPKKLGILTRITDEMRRFQGFGYEALMRNDLIRAAAKKLDYTVIYGRGTDNEPRGVMSMVNAPNLATVATTPSVQVYRGETGLPWDGTTVADSDGKDMTFDDLMNMMGMLEDLDLDIDASFAWISNPRFWRRLKQLKTLNFSGQTTGQPYLLGVPMLTDARLKDLIGPFDKTTQVPSNGQAGGSVGWGDSDGSHGTKHGDVICGNWSEVILGRWSGIEIEDDRGTGTGFIKDQTNIKFKMYADIGHREERSIVVCPDAKMID